MLPRAECVDEFFPCHLSQESGDHINDHMARQLTATEAKAKFLSLLDEVEGGEEIEITRHGITVARIVSARGPHALAGRFAGVALTAAPDEELFTTGASPEQS